jgi:hypothetical protein
VDEAVRRYIRHKANSDDTELLFAEQRARRRRAGPPHGRLEIKMVGTPPFEVEMSPFDALIYYQLEIAELESWIESEAKKLKTQAKKE